MTTDIPSRTYLFIPSVTGLVLEEDIKFLKFNLTLDMDNATLRKDIATLEEQFRNNVTQVVRPL